MDLQWSSDRTYFITASKDKTAKIISARDLSLMKTYPSETPLNTAAITPKKDFVILGGGQAAMDVTRTSSRQGKFEARFYHKIFEDEIGRVKGHFGPLNTIAVDPQGRGYASGGEDGYVRVSSDWCTRVASLVILTPLRSTISTRATSTSYTR